MKVSLQLKIVSFIMTFIVGSSILGSTYIQAASVDHRISTNNIIQPSSPTQLIARIATIAVKGVTLNKTSATIEQNLTASLVATISPSNATNKSVTWKSSNTSVATVDSKGKVKAVSSGTATITVRTAVGGKSASASIKVITVAVNSVSLDKSTLTLEKNKSTSLVATVSPANATNKNVTWTSSKDTIATVDSAGKVTAKAVGTAIITVKTKDGSKSSSTTITVKIPSPKSIERIFKDINPSVAYVECYDFNDVARFTGSGFLVKSNGTLVTNFHVIYNEDYPIKYVNIKFGDGRVFKNVTQVLDYDASNDIAVLKIPNLTNSKYVPVTDSNLINTGESVVAIGSPLGLENTISEGIISAKTRTVNGVNFIQISVPFDHGSSGGVLLNRQGEAIGVTSAIIESGASLNLAVPINVYKKMKLDKNTSITELNYPNVYQGLIIGETTIDEIEPNYSLVLADVLTHTKNSVSGSLSSSTDTDVFKVTISTPWRTANVGGFILAPNTRFTNSIDIAIHDPNGNVIGSSTLKYGSDNEPYLSLIIKDLSPGTYYFVVFSTDYAATFDLYKFSYFLWFDFYKS